MKRIFLSLVLIITFFNMAYSQYAESFFSSNPYYKQELEKNGAIAFSIPATINYKPLGVINWSEGFEGTTFPPTGWAVHNLDGGTNTWIRYTTSPIFGTASAAVRWESSTLRNDDWLITPQFNVNPGAFLNFYAKRQSTSYFDSVEIYYSTSGGVPPTGYNYLTTIMPAGTTPELFQISLNALAGQNVYIAFRYKELDEFRFYLDSVYVETPVAIDAGVSAINRPTNFETTLGAIPQVVVKNFGVNPTGTFQAHLMIEPGGYHQVMDVGSLNTGETAVLDFATWIPATKGQYQVIAYTTLSGDLNPQNDTLKKNVNVTEELYRDFIHNVTNLYPGGLSLYGVEYANNYFYISKWNENKIYRINTSGTSIDSFTISGLSATSGLRDLAWDGEFLYGSTATTSVYKIDLTTFTATTAFTSPISVRGIAYDKANDAFWVANWNTDLRLVSRTGTTLQTITAASHGLTGMSGLAYDTLSGGGNFIWVLNGGSAADQKILYKINAATGLKVDSFKITHHLPEGAIGGGVFCTDKAYVGSVTLGVLNQGTPHLITGYKIGTSVVPSSISILYPMGGENLLTNSKQLIVWKSENLTGNINVLVSVDGGNTFETLASNIPNTGFYSLTAPQNPVSGVLLKVESSTNPSIFDLSEPFNVITGTNPEVDFPLVVSDGIYAEGLRTGLHPTATDGIDTDLGEYELPPVPPSTVFDARLIGTDIGIPQLGNGVTKDYRQGSSSYNGQKVHEIKYQVSQLARFNSNPITIYWDLPSNVTGRLQDLVTGNEIDVLMSGTGSYTVNNPSLYDKLKVTYTYSPGIVNELKLLYPNGGEIFRKGSNVVIAWKTNFGGLVRLFASTDGGSNWILIEDSLANSGVFGSSIGYDTPESNQWKLKIQSIDNPSVYDESDGTFTIQGTKLVYMDNPFVISDGQSSVGLFYGLDPTATDGIDLALGEAELPPPPPTGVFDGRFVGTDIGIPQLGQGTLKDYRQGGSSFSGNKIHEIQYQMGSGDSLRLFWYLPNNVTGLLQDFFGGGIVNVPMSGAGKFTVPNPGILNKLKITLTYTPEPATVQVVQPNGGENLFVGQTYQIIWNSTGISNVKLEYTTDGGATWINIATVPALNANKVKLSNKHPKDRNAYIEGNLGVYNWVVPNTPSNQCKVKVSDASNPSVYDMSDNFFTISAPLTEGWVVQNSGTTAELYSVSAVNENVAWACGDGGVVIRTTNGGQTWQTVTPPRTVAAYVIWAVSENKAFVGTSGTTDAKIHLTTDGGQTWQDVYTITGGFLNVIRMIDANNGWAQSDPVGGNWVLLKTTNGGLTWSSLATVPQAGSEYGWNNSGWDKTGYLWFGTNNSRIYYSTNNGSNWAFSVTTSANSYAVAFDNNLVGLSGFAAGVLNRSTNGGVNWNAIPSPTTAAVTGIATVSNNEFFVAAGGSIWKTSDDGNNWSLSYGGTGSVYHLSFVPTLSVNSQPAAGWAVGAGGLVIKYRRQIQQPMVQVIQPNGGENWPVGSTQNIVWNAQLISNVKLQYTTNNGASWIDIATVPASKVQKLRLDGYSPKDPNGVIEGELGIYAWVIPNTPSTQCKVRVSDASNPSLYDESDNTFIISEGVIGESWTVQNSGTTATLYSVSTVDANVAWATGSGGTVIKTTNGGVTWTTVTSPRAVDAHIICGVSATKALVATNGSADAKIHLTTNGGLTWTDVFTQAGGFINVIIMFDDMNGFAEGDPVGGNWTLLKTTDGGFTWTSAATVPQVGGEYGWNNSGWNVGNNLWFGTNNSRVYKSTDGGTTWSFAPTTVANSYSVAFGNAQKGVVGSATGTANRSTDGGNSWLSISTPATGNILGMTTVGDEEFWFTAGTSVYYTSNHGTNWSTEFTASAVLYHLNFKGLGGSNAVGYAVGANGYVVKYFRGPITPQVVVVSPNGGENWTVGSTRQIVWNAQGVTNVKLEYSTNNGSTWNYIATVPALSEKRINEDAESLDKSIDGTLGVYNWVIPNTPSNQCLVKVSDASNPAVFDVSDNVFTISSGLPGPQLQFNYDISALAPGVYSLYGSEFDGEYFYITRWNEPKIFRVNKLGTQIDSFTVTGLPSGGFRDLAFDGQYLYGSNNSTTVYRIDRNTFNAIAAFTSPVPVRGISYNAAQNAFWVANWSTDIVLVSRTGATLYTIPATQHGFTGMSGNAYDTLSPGSPYLWIFSGGIGTDPKVLYKVNPANGQRLDSIDVTNILPDGAIGGGLWITDQFEPNTVTLGGSSQAVPHRLFGFKIHEFGPIPGTVTVLSPNGGEKFYKGQWILLTWKSYEFDSRVIIKVSSDGGNTFFDVASNIPNNGVFAVQVPFNAIAGDQYKVRILSQTDSTKYDDSDGFFEIADAPYTLPVVDLPMVVSDNENSRLLRFGLDPAATDSIDSQFGEEELPPAPPAGVLDGRFIGDDIGLQFGQGLAYDYRNGRANTPSIKVHELKFQRGSGEQIVINLYLPADVTARFESFTPGFDTTVSGVAKVIVTDTLLNKLKMTLNYFPGSALGTFNLFGPINNALVTVRQNDSTIVTFRWYKAKNAVSYRLRMGVPAIPPFMLDTPSNNNGTDSLFTIRQYELFNLFSKPNYPTDTTVTGQWAVWAYGVAGDSVRSNSIYSIRLRLVKFVNVDDESDLVPDNFVVYQNYPNPFNPSTKIKFGLPEDANVTVDVFNVVGEKVATLWSGNMKKGYHEMTFDASGLNTGVYFYKVTTGKFSVVKKMLLIK